MKLRSLPPEPTRRIVVVTNQGEAVGAIKDQLKPHGLEMVDGMSADAFQSEIPSLTDVLLIFRADVKAQVIAMLTRLRRRGGARVLAMVVGSHVDEFARRCYAAGCDDYVPADVADAQLAERVLGLCANRGYARSEQEKERDAEVMLELTQALASSLDFSEILSSAVNAVRDVVSVDRACVVLTPQGDSPDVGFLVSTSEDPDLINLRLNLEESPDLLHVIRSCEELTVPYIPGNPVLEAGRPSDSRWLFGALTLLPIVWRDEAMGVLLLRSSRPGRLSRREIGFCRIAMNATAISLRNARVLQSLRDQTQKVNFARFEAERRLRSLSRYANLFASAADGLAALDMDGKLLFANPKAFEILDTDEDSMSDHVLADFIYEEDRQTAIDVWMQVKSGDHAEAIDLRVAHGDDAFKTLSCSFSPLTESQGAVLVSFRDVTAERATASELARTKEFLESMINASVDCIVAADLKGTLLLFNKGAERLFGWQADAMIGKMSVRVLYPKGKAESIMRMLRSENHGGVGRLRSVRFEALARDGELIPIELSAALIFDQEGKAFASVGIFRDLRQQLRVEERLAQAQQKLAMTEKQALIAELAGTAAHELNQPLTSVIAYGELLQRKLGKESSESRAAMKIVGEAERMAEIVRKIGQVTHYETKDYVGDQKILDLDKAVAGPGPNDAVTRVSSAPPKEVKYIDSEAPESSADSEVPSHFPSELPGPMRMLKPTDTGRRKRFDVLTARREREARKGRLLAPSSNEMLYGALELNRTIDVEMHEEVIVRRYLEYFRKLFPRRRFAVRLIDMQSGKLAYVFSTGVLDSQKRNQIVISRAAQERHELTREKLAHADVGLGEAYQQIFAEPGAGFDVPIRIAGAFAGLLSVEYEEDLEETAFDRSLIVPLVVHLSAALRNARLLCESNSLRDRLSQLLEHANASILVIGPERDLRVANRAFLATTGLAREDVLGQDFLSLLPEPERARFLPVFVRGLKGEPTDDFELRLPKVEGGVARILINTAAIHSGDGDVEGLVAIGRDLTEQRELEEQILQAEKLATLGQLAAGIVHELNNPLTSITVYSDYLLKKGERTRMDPDDLKKLRRIVKSGERILKFTRDLVTYSRPTTDESDFVRIRDILEQSLVFCEHVIVEAKVKVKRCYLDTDCSVYAVKGQLHQVFINLITNACHATDEGGEILLTTTSVPGGDVEILVEDTGCGIPEEQRAKIFEPFFSTKAEGEGTGLGLSIVRNIVRQHGGTIRVYGREPNGTGFELKFPARQLPEESKPLI